jgi:hypothetical protein
MEMDDLTYLHAIQLKYKLKNLSGAFHALIRQHEILCEEKIKAREAIKERSTKPSNPFVKL